MDEVFEGLLKYNLSYEECSTLSIEIRKMMVDNPLLEVGEVELICYDTWITEKVVREREREQLAKIELEIRNMEKLEREKEQLAKMQMEEEISNFLSKSETKDHNPILVRSIESGIPFTFSLTDLATTVVPVDILVLTGSMKSHSPIDTMSRRVGFLPLSNLVLSHCLSKLHWKSPPLSDQEGLFKEVWWFNCESKDPNVVFTKLHESIVALSAIYERNISIYLPLEGLQGRFDEEEFKVVERNKKTNSKQELIHKWNHFKSLLVQLSDHKINNINKIVIFTSKPEFLRIMNLLTEGFPPIILHNNCSEVVRNCLTVFEKIKEEKNFQSPITKSIQIMNYSIHSTLMHCEASIDDNPLVSHLLAGLCQLVSLNCRFILEHLLMLIADRFGFEGKEKLKFESLTVFKRFQLLQLLLSGAYDRIPDLIPQFKNTPFIRVFLKDDMEDMSWSEIFRLGDIIRLQTNPIVHNTSLWEIASLDLRRDLLSPLFDLLVRLELVNIWVTTEDDCLFRINHHEPKAKISLHQQHHHQNHHQNQHQSQPVNLKTSRQCGFFNTSGGCGRGPTCPFLHTRK